ncbi:GDSL-type esterase/lipase family protein [Bosea sp. Root381]|uniref:SGNH/GDSL hydrolase family protein n=1 Tax=Bosea sp. Root381 TaxID=1736524 RepID=UPI00138F0ED3|nr:GDSL-type esterase/lipase family protein [Bosea sp. Root381]
MAAFVGPMPSAAANDLRCRAGAAQTPFQPVLPNARAALRETGKLTIVAIGSSTTAGAGASAEDMSYPAVVQAELRRRLPNIEVSVVNKGVGGQSAFDMLMRMDSDVIELKPSLVIWQTGVTEAIGNAGEEKFAKILRKGIRKVQAAGIDMVMMDLPWLQRESRYPQYDDYRAVLKKTADGNGVSVFPRYGIMRDWARTKRFSAEELVGMDGMHVVDAGYRCLGIRIADGIVAAVTGPKPEIAVFPRRTD